MIRTNNKVALYARYSSDNQRSESIDAQLRAMKAYCEQNKFVIVETYIDEARSATTDNRPSFQKMIADSANHFFNILLVHKLDRFARNRYDSAVYKRELKKNGVQVYSVLENLDNSPESIMMEAVLEGMAEYYSQNLGREVIKGMRENALKCIHTGGKPPLGYDVDPETKKLVINETEAESVRIIYTLYSKGYGYSYILEQLNREGRRTKKGSVFQKNSLYSILTNPKYQEIYVFNRSSAKSFCGTRNTHLLKDSDEVISIDGGCPQIVDAQTYEKVQCRIDAQRHKGGRLNAKTTYLLSGTVFCKNCGRSMTGNSIHSGRNKALYITYRCPNKGRYCDNKDINRDYLESYVIFLLEKEVFSSAAMNRIVQRITAGKSSSLESLQKQQQQLADALSQTNQALANVANAVANGLLSDALSVKLRELEAEKSKLLAQLNACSHNENSLPAIDGKLIRSTYKKLKAAPSSPEYKAFIQSFIGKIAVGRYMVDITLKTGLDVCPELDITYSVKRQEIYEEKKMAKMA